MDNAGDDFNVAIVATARAEMGARGWSVDDLLLRLPDGLLSRRTLFRLVDTAAPPDRATPLWRSSYIAAVADAFGMTPYQFIAEVERRQARMRGEVVPPSDHVKPSIVADVRTVIRWLLAHPEDDEELQTRLSETSAQVDASGKRMARLLDTIRAARHAELTAALDALPPSSGGPEVGAVL